MRISFLIPSYNDDFRPAIKELIYCFPKSKILVISDGGKVFETTRSKKVKVIRFEKNIGLAKTLVFGYKVLSKRSLDYVVRIDADLEYPIASIKQAVRAIKCDETIIGAMVSVPRHIKSIGLLDYLFHRIMGFFEGLILTGESWIQHSPGLQIYKKEVVVAIASAIEEYESSYKNRWGIDLIAIGAAARIGRVVQIKHVNQNWYQRRPVKKIFAQFFNATAFLVRYLTVK